jgi:hypothetical protein
MPASITGKDIRKQLKADLIGKDSYRGVTLTYSWLANQFGHIALGFIPTFILYLILAKDHGSRWAAFWSAVFIAGTWLLFEISMLLLVSHENVFTNSAVPIPVQVEPMGCGEN